MPAGSYTVTPLEIDHSLIEISNGRNVVLLLTERRRPERPAEARRSHLHQQGDTYVLREIWDAANVTGAEAIELHAGHEAHSTRAR